MLWLDVDDVLIPDVLARLREARQTLRCDELAVVSSPCGYYVCAEIGECTFSRHRER